MEIDALALIKSTYNRNIRDGVTEQNPKNHSWYLGNVSCTRVPLLNYIKLKKGVDNKIVVLFEHHNVQVDSTEPTGLLDRHKNSFPHIIDLGFVPVSVLLRKPLETYLSENSTIKSLESHFGDSYNSSINTKAFLINSRIPVCFVTREEFDAIVKSRADVSRFLIGDQLSDFNTGSGSKESTEPSSSSKLKSEVKFQKTNFFDLINCHTNKATSAQAFLKYLNNSVAQNIHCKNLVTVQQSQSIGSTMIKFFENIEKINQSNTHESEENSVQQTASAKATSLRVYDYLKMKKLKPILIVPNVNSSTAIFNNKNIQYFLENRQLPAPDTLLDDTHSNTDSFVWSVSLPIQDASLKRKLLNIDFKVVDETQVRKFHPNDWFRVVGAILQGAEWQIKNWPFANPQNVFQCIKSFYFSFDYDPVPEFIKRNQVEVIKLNRVARHNDTPVWHQFVLQLGTVFDKPLQPHLYLINNKKT